MSTAALDISSSLIDALYTTLNGNVTVSGITYDVYKTVYSGQTNRAYVHIGDVIDNENGTKEEFIYEGSIAIESVDEQQTGNVSRSTVQAINNKVRSLLKPTRTTVPTISGRSVTVFRLGGGTIREEQTKDKRTRYVITDIYEFIIS